MPVQRFLISFTKLLCDKNVMSHFFLDCSLILEWKCGWRHTSLFSGTVFEFSLHRPFFSMMLKLRQIIDNTRCPKVPAPTLSGSSILICCHNEMSLELCNQRQRYLHPRPVCIVTRNFLNEVLGSHQPIVSTTAAGRQF